MTDTPKSADCVSVPRELLIDIRDNGLIYWEPQTERGFVARTEMVNRIDAALASSPAAPGGEDGRTTIQRFLDILKECRREVWISYGDKPGRHEYHFRYSDEQETRLSEAYKAIIAIDFATSPSHERERALEAALKLTREYLRGDLLEGAVVLSGGPVIALGKYIDNALAQSAPAAGESTIRDRVWSDEARAAVRAVEDEYDISVCSLEHLEEWVDRCEQLKRAAIPTPQPVIDGAAVERAAREYEKYNPFMLSSDHADALHAALIAAFPPTEGVAEMTHVWKSEPHEMRRVSFNTPRGWARCEECGEILNYQYASIRWRCSKRDLCPKHAAEESFTTRKAP